MDVSPAAHSSVHPYTGRSVSTRSGSVPHEANPFRSGSRDNMPSFQECFAGVASAERYMAFSDSMHATSPQRTWQHASPGQQGGAGAFTVRSLSSSAGDDLADVVAPPQRIERSPIVPHRSGDLHGDSLDAVRRAAHPATPVMSPVLSHRLATSTPTVSRDRATDVAGAAAATRFHRETTFAVAQAAADDDAVSPASIDDAVIDRIAREVTAQVRALLQEQLDTSHAGGSTRYSLKLPRGGAGSAALDDLDMDDGGDFTYYRPQFRRYAAAALVGPSLMLRRGW